MNLVTDIMLTDPVLCTSDMRVAEIKYLLKKYDYDEMLVVDSLEEKHPIGLVSLADMDLPEIEEADMPSDVSALECMREIPAVVLDSSTLEECLNVMRANHLDRIPVVDLNGHFEGIIEKDQIAKTLY
ncbi:CBS domain-containing protein [Bacteriovorax sp. PP10]|uniref:CBS domain-containing protein n=1 Tax=Bacteriovorax antarcticus TaxID=3088717 RepID=A0ABU5VWE1_9BACT|nr:CBS domain-containing protein [Bacteriovorax sp. PP10]MEA9357386.1 CBS domain-containing protein [Bacteriovorax sp. PP10]